MNGNHFLKTDLNSCQWKLIFQLVETIFFHCLRYFLRSSSSRLVETQFPVQKKKYCFLLRNFFPTSGKHYLTHRKAYLKLLSLLLEIIFLYFSDVFANVSSFFVQQKCILKQVLHSYQWKPIFCLLERVFFLIGHFFSAIRNPIFEK